MSESMVERVARAIGEPISETLTATFMASRESGHKITLSEEFLMRLARAAIAAMREPTKEMVKAAEESGALGGYGFTDTECVAGDPYATWQAMIGAALGKDGL